MSIWLYGFAGGSFFLGIIGWYLWYDFYMKTKDLSAPFLKVARSKGKKILLLVDTGTGSYKLVDAEREALGYSTKEFGNFEAYEEGIKPFGSGIKKVPLGLAHAELEVVATPGAAIWVQSHGKQLTQDTLDSMPDIVQYLYCDNKIEEDKICGWIGPLMAQDGDRPSKVKDLWKKIVDASRNEKNVILPKPEEMPEEPTCPQCKAELKEVKTDRTYSTIPNQVVYSLSKVRDWVEEVVSPLNMELAIEATKLATMKKAKTNMDEYMKILMVLGPLALFGALAYVMIQSQSGGAGEPGMMQSMGQTLKSGASGG